MNEPPLEVADVMRAHEQSFVDRYGPSLSTRQWQVIRAITSCRSKRLGGHVERCSDCGHQRIAYNSCRDRHCPKCQAQTRAEWMAAREQEILPVQYFHVVFTMPELLAPVALQNKETVYGILFQSAAETLMEVAGNPKHLGARIGFLAILHTWSQNLMHHPHLHCVVPAGGISPDGGRWVHCRRTKRDKKPFFLPVRVLSRVFRAKFVDKLKQAFQQGKLVLVNRLSHLHNRAQFNQLLSKAVQKDWVVYAKQPFGGPSQTLKYLARYTHRVAISNERLIRMVGDRVTFRWKDYADGSRVKTMTLHACEFMRRFLMHTLPRGFVRIRHFGFLSNRNRHANITRCRKLLQTDKLDKTSTEIDARPSNEFEETVIRCPCCKLGRMLIIEVVPPERSPIPLPHFTTRKRQVVFDTS